MQKPTIEIIKQTVKESQSVKEVFEKLNCGRRYIENRIKKYNIDTSHFNKNGSYKRLLYPTIIKICPNCQKEFTTKSGSPKEKYSCSYRCCALLRDTPSVTKHKQSKGLPKNVAHSEHYRPICFETFEEKCQICGFDECVEVHHIDGNRENPNRENLIPLCPNHHVMVHTEKHYQDIQSKIDKIMYSLFENYSNIVPQRIFLGYKGNLIKHDSKIPDKIELQKIVWEIPSTKVAKHYNVSDSTIVNWCRKLNINKPPVGYWSKRK